MKIRQALEHSGQQPALFISDPTGDIFVLGDGADKFPVPPTAEGVELTTADDLLKKLDFEAYELGRKHNVFEEPTVYLTAKNGGFVRI